MDRRTFTAALAATAAATQLPRAHAAPLPVAQNVVLVHGLFADGSSRSGVIALLQAAGLHVTAVQNPLTTLPEAVAETVRVLDRQPGPTVLAGHSFEVHSSHVSLISHPRQIASLILQAAGRT